jgi:TATA-box binding protein (TBP) (component of TFIID and TFIIIB)
MLQFKPIEPYQEPSPIRISTISALAQLKVGIDLKRLFEVLPLAPETTTGILSLKYYEKQALSESEQADTGKHGKVFLHHRHSENKLDVSPVKSHFQNQLTLLWCFVSRDGTLKRGNGFVFNNGKIKTVGLKCEEDIRLSYETLCSILQKYCVGQDVFLSNEPVSTVTLHEMRPTMYNTDFSVHFNLMRDVLFHKIISTYGLVESEYEPDIYPAVKIKFSWNRDYLFGDSCYDKTPGRCYCGRRCNGKGLGHSDGGCKVVTICAFQSGKIIITGGNSYEQVEYMYAFINKVMKLNYEELYYRVPVMVDEPSKKAAPPKKRGSSKKVSTKKGELAASALNFGHTPVQNPLHALPEPFGGLQTHLQ